jgi:hypothetical protein
VLVPIATTFNLIGQSATTATTFFPASVATSLVSTLSGLTAVVAYLVALLKYRLYDADAAIGRSAAFGAITLVLLAIFAGSEKIIEVLGEEYFGREAGALAAGLATAIAAVMIVPIHHRVSHWAEKRFLKHLLKLRRGLPVLVGDLRETAGADRMAAAVLDNVREGVRATRAALLINDDLAGTRGVSAAEVEEWRSGWKPVVREGLDWDKHDRLFTMRVPLDADAHGRIGWLLLGPRPDGSFYGKDERAALAEIADPVARAIEIVRIRDQREQRQESRITAMEQSIAAALRSLLPLAAPKPAAAD